MHLPSRKSNQTSQNLEWQPRQEPITQNLKSNPKSKRLLWAILSNKSLASYTKVGRNRGPQTVILSCEKLQFTSKGQVGLIAPHQEGEMRMRLPRVKGELL